MSEFISVPRDFVENYLHRAAFPARCHVYGDIEHEYVNTTFSTYGFSGFKFSCTFKRLKQSRIDKLLGRTRFNLVHVYNDILGSQGEEDIDPETRKLMKDWANIDHLDIRYRHFRTWKP